MRRVRRLTVAACVLAAGLLPAGMAQAGPLWDCLHGCAPPDYSPLHYWTPALTRLHDCWHGPHIPLRAPDRHPEVPTGFVILPFRCPPADPAATQVPVPTPPPESKAR
jgi:hypothetical protein